MVTFFCIRALAFPGKNELNGFPSNEACLGILELLSEYNAFLAERIRMHASKGRGRPSYLSSTIYEEIIELIGQKVLSIIVDEV